MRRRLRGIGAAAAKCLMEHSRSSCEPNPWQKWFTVYQASFRRRTKSGRDEILWSRKRRVASCTCRVLGCRPQELILNIRKAERRDLTPRHKGEEMDYGGSTAEDHSDIGQRPTDKR